jgi:DNA-directed RNA polymerase specialized sigma24 family protein
VRRNTHAHNGTRPGAHPRSAARAAQGALPGWLAAAAGLLIRHAPWLAARLRPALPPPDVEEVLQKTFLAVWKSASGYRPRGMPQAWVI